MRRFFPLCFLLTITSNLLWGQNSPAIEWQKCLGGSGVDQSRYIEPTKDGGYIITGTTESNNGNVTNHQGTVNAQNIWVVKTNSAGIIEWQKAIGSATGYYWGSVVHQTSDGGYVVSGAAAENSPFTDYYLAKLSSTGTILWEKKYGGDKTDYCNSMQLTKDGGFILAGYSESDNRDVSGNHGGKDFWVIKLNSAGTLEWQRSLGGTGNDEAFSVQQSWDFGYIVVGKTESNNGNVSGNRGGVDCWVVKLSSSGTLEWQKCMGGSNADEAWSVQLTFDLNYVIAGYTASNDQDVSGNHGVASGDYWVVKINTSGTIIWQKCLGGVLSDEAFFIQNTEDGGFIVAGTTNSFDGDVKCNAGTDDYWIVKLNNVGFIQWQKSLGGIASDVALCIQQTIDKGYIITGRTCSFLFPDYHQGSCGDFFVVKLSGSENNQTLNVDIVPDLPVVCSGLPYTLVATTYYTGPTPTWQWKRNGVVVQALGNTAYVASDFKENDTVICTIKIPATCNTLVTEASDTVVIKINNASPAINLTANATTICKGTIVTLNANVQNAGAFQTYVWKLNGAIIPNATANQYGSDGLKDGDEFTVTYTDNSTCLAGKTLTSNTVRIKVNPASTPAINISTPTSSVCVGASVTFTAAATGSGANPVYQWKINGANTGTNSNTFSSSILQTGDIVSCMVTADPSQPCLTQPTAVSNNIAVTVSAVTVPTVSITSTTNNVCAGTGITFNAVVNNAGTTPAYQWKVNNNNAGTNAADFSSTTLKNGDEVTCVLVGNMNTCSNTPVTSNTIPVVIYEIPVINIVPPDTSIKPGNRVQLQTTVSGSIGTYDWSPASKLEDPQSISPTTISLLSTTTYTLNVVSSDGCPATKTVKVRVEKPLIMPNAFSPNNDRYNNIFRISPDASIKLEEFSVFDRWGNKVFTTKDVNIGWDGTFHGKQSAAGIYIYYIRGTGEKGKVLTKGIVVLVR